MTKTKELTIFNKFKLGDKIWYEEPMQPFRKRVPGIIEKDKIQTVGKHRDAYITSDISPYVNFTDIDVSSVLKRKKIFPGEKERLKLGVFGVEKDYIKWKRDYEDTAMLSVEEERLLEKVKHHFKRGFGYYECNYALHYGQETIENLIRKGVIRRESARTNPEHNWLIPAGKRTPRDMYE